MTVDGAACLSANYITNMSLENASGGWNGMNAALYSELSRFFQLNYVGPVNPPASGFQRLWARATKGLGWAPSFYFFSDRRLNSIARMVAQKLNPGVKFDYFHGLTPWIACQPTRPSFAYADACFLTYYDTYHQRDRFMPGDLQRIARQEKAWLQRMSRVYFSSQYAIEECCRRYELKACNFEWVGLGASVASPASDTYRGGYKLIFVAVDFARKGGQVCLEAFVRFRQRFPEATLTLIGARPPADVLERPGVQWAGFLTKEVPEQLEQFKAHLSSAFALVLPTISDMTPLVVAEAALHGCPTLAPRAFGIPEMITDNLSGRLLPVPPQADQFAEALVQLANSPEDYLQMRRHAREQALTRFTWGNVGQRIASSIVQHLENIGS